MVLIYVAHSFLPPPPFKIMSSMAECYIAIKDYKGAQKILGRFFAKISSLNVDKHHQDKDYVAGVLVTYSSILLRNQQYDQYTEHVITFALHLRDDLQIGWYWLGQLYLARKNYSKATQITIQAFNMDPKCVDAILLLGVVCQRLEVPDEGRLLPEAAWCYLAALAQEPSCREAVMRLGEVYEKTQLYQEAASLYVHHLKKMGSADEAFNRVLLNRIGAALSKRGGKRTLKSLPGMVAMPLLSKMKDANFFETFSKDIPMSLLSILKVNEERGVKKRPAMLDCDNAAAAGGILQGKMMPLAKQGPPQLQMNAMSQVQGLQPSESLLESHAGLNAQQSLSMLDAMHPLSAEFNTDDLPAQVAVHHAEDGLPQTNLSKGKGKGKAGVKRHAGTASKLSAGNLAKVSALHPHLYNGGGGASSVALAAVGMANVGSVRAATAAPQIESLGREALAAMIDQNYSNPFGSNSSQLDQPYVVAAGMVQQPGYDAGGGGGGAAAAVPSSAATKKKKRATTDSGSPQKRAATASADNPEYPRAQARRNTRLKSSVRREGEVDAKDDEGHVKLVGTKRESEAPSLQKWASKRSICIIRGLINAVGFDASHFQPKVLLEKDNGSFTLEVREQPANIPGDTNWLLQSTPSESTLAEYIDYQDTVEPLDGSAPKLKPSSGKQENLKFGCDLDLSDSRRWAKQLREIAKLPSFFKLKKSGDMLNRIGYKIYGMNTVQMYLKVKGARTPAHQENNNFVSGNLSLGPGRCEWFAVDIAYQEEMKKLCAQRKLNFLSGSWWPNLKDLEAAGIPYTRFYQEPGDFVYTNMGTIHWVQALGRCQNVAWNMGPMTAKQLRLAWDRYDELRAQKEQSLVPMHKLTWSLVDFRKKANKFDDAFVKEIAAKAAVSLEKQKMIMQQLEQHNVTIHRCPLENDMLNQHIVCSECLDEPFNTFYLEKHPANSGKDTHIFCPPCTRKIRSKVELQCVQLRSVANLSTSLDTFINGGHPSNDRRATTDGSGGAAAAGAGTAAAAPLAAAALAPLTAAPSAGHLQYFNPSGGGAEGSLADASVKYIPPPSFSNPASVSVGGQPSGRAGAGAVTLGGLVQVGVGVAHL